MGSIIEITKFLKKFEEVFAEKNIDCITTTKIRLGQFTFHGQQIYEDLITNEQEIISNEFVSSLCGGSQIIQSAECAQGDNEDNVDDFLTEEEDYTILDADESQLRSIKAVVDGKHLVIHGPPGTGKSQTIANLIANLLAGGKKVLFVCEKQVALDVVFSRLKTKGADVSDLCLPLFQYTADKKLFAKSILDSRNRIIDALRNVSKNSINEKLVARKEKIDLLKKYANALLSIQMPINKTIYWMHGELARALPRIGSIVFPWRDKGTDEISFAAYQKINHILNELSGFSGLIFDKNNHWKNLEQTSFSPDYIARFFGKLEELRQLVEAFPKLKETAFGAPKSINKVYHILNFANNADIEELLKNKLIVSDVFDEISLQNEMNFSEKIKQILNKYTEIAGNGYKYKVPTEWCPTVLWFSLLDKNLEISKLVLANTEISFIEDKVETLEKTILNSGRSKELMGFSGKTISKCKNLFDIDPSIQKIKGWDERTSLYEIQNILKNIKNVYDQLTNAQEILNEWAISTSEISSKVIWEVEHRFSTKYKTFLRVFYPTYKTDKELITSWCCARRPKNYLDYKQIIITVTDRLHLQAKFEKMVTDFLEKHAIDNSVKSISVDIFTESVSKILSYFKLEGVDKLNTKTKILVSASDTFNSFKQIVTLYEELLNQKLLLNIVADQNLLNGNLSLNDFLKSVKEVILEVHNVVSIYEKSNEFLIRRSSNLEELHFDVYPLNKPTHAIL